MPLIQGVIDSFWRQGVWTTDRRAWPEAAFFGGGKLRARFRLTFHESHTEPTETQIRAAWEWRDGLDEWVEEVIVQLLKLYHYNKSFNGRIAIDTNTLLRSMGHEKPQARYQDRVNRAVYLAPMFVVQDLRYQFRATTRRDRATDRDLSGFAEHLFTYNYRPAQKGRGKNVVFDIQLGRPLLQMADDLHTQLADMPAGITAPDGRSPYRAALNRRLPIKAKERKDQFNKSGITVRELLSIAGCNVASIDPRKRTGWRRTYLAEILDSTDMVQAWEYITGPADTWDRWLEDRIRLMVRTETSTREEIATERQLLQTE